MLAGTVFRLLRLFGVAALLLRGCTVAGPINARKTGAGAPPSCQQILEETLAKQIDHRQSPQIQQRADVDVTILRQGYANRCLMQAQPDQVLALQSQWTAENGVKALKDNGWQRLVASQRTIDICVQGLPPRDTAARPWPEGVGVGQRSPPVMAVLWRHVQGADGNTEHIAVKKLNKSVSGRLRKLRHVRGMT